MITRAVDPFDWAALLTLLRRSFAYMDGRIDPPSSLNKLDEVELAAISKDAEIWVIHSGCEPIVTLTLTPKKNHLYLGKLAVSPDHRGQGFARKLVDHARARAISLGFDQLRLQTRIELVENHATFAKLGFHKFSEDAHPGYDRVTEITMAMDLCDKDHAAHLGAKLVKTTMKSRVSHGCNDGEQE